MAISSVAEAIKIPQQQAELLSTLMRLSPNTPVDVISRLVLQDASFCNKLLDILFPQRPPSMSEALIHEGIRNLGVDRVRQLFLTHNLAQAFGNVRLGNFDVQDFWVNAIQKAFIAFDIAEKLEYADVYEAFVTGLLSNIGSLLLAARFPHLSEHFRDIRSRPVEVRSAVERILTGVTHTEEVSRSGLTHLIPPRVIQSLGRYTEPYPGDDRQALLTTMTAVSVSIGDMTYTTPLQQSLASVQRNIKMLPSSTLSIEKLFADSSQKAYNLCKDLGYDVPEPMSLEELQSGKIRTMQEEEDPLAGLFKFTMERQIDNRVGFLAKLEENLTDSSRKEDISIMLIDVDNFSKINDTYGFPTADALLQHLGQEIIKSMKVLDHVARIDADQFALLLPKTQAMGAKVVAERMRALVKASTIAMGTIRPNCTASVGGLTVTISRKITDPMVVWNKLLQLTKHAKDNGKNRIIWAS